VAYRHHPDVAARSQAPLQCGRGGETFDQGRDNNGHRERGAGEEDQGQEHCKHIGNPCDAPPAMIRLREA
jgi:hypothetical protein